MLISEHAFFLGLYTAQFSITLKLVYNMRDGVELLYTLICQISPGCISPFCPSSCVHCHFYLAMLITVYSVLFLTQFKLLCFNNWPEIYMQQLLLLMLFRPSCNSRLLALHQKPLIIRYACAVADRRQNDEE